MCIHHSPSLLTTFDDNSAGILPSNTTTYTLSQITNALYSQIGAVPYLGCYDNGTILDEVWYFHHVIGTVCRVDQDCSDFLNLDLGAIWSLQNPQFHHSVELHRKWNLVL
jgi:hypothetical protein